MKRKPTPKKANYLQRRSTWTLTPFSFSWRPDIFAVLFNGDRIERDCCSVRSSASNLFLPRDLWIDRLTFGVSVLVFGWVGFALSISVCEMWGERERRRAGWGCDLKFWDPLAWFFGVLSCPNFLLLFLFCLLWRFYPWDFVGNCNVLGFVVRVQICGPLWSKPIIWEALGLWMLALHNLSVSFLCEKCFSNKYFLHFSLFVWH